MSSKSAISPPARRSIKERLGLDHGGDRYRYAADARFGMMHADHVPERWVRTTCGYCSVGCGMLVGVRDGRAVTVKGDPDHPVNAGRLCPKGLSEHLTIAADGRLLTPTVDGIRSSWDHALDTLVGRFSALMDAHGPESVGVISTGQLVTEEFYALGKLARLGFGFTHYDGNTTLCMASAVAGYKMAFGSDGPPSSYADLALADCLLLIGANLADNHPLLMPLVLDNTEGTIITVDPRVTKTAMIADLHLAIRPRTDISLLNGIINVLIDEDLIDHDYVRDHTEGFAELKAHVAAFSLERVAAECGVSGEDVRRTALAFGRAERGMVAWTMGVNHSVRGTETVALIATLCAITGNIGRPGTGPFSITGQCNAMGTRETGFTASMPGYRAYDNPDHRRELAGLWGIDESRLPAARGRAYPDIIEGIIAGKIKALWVIGTNPIVSFPNRDLLELAFDKLDLLVVQDGFETPTTERAHIVLPTAIWGEKDGTYTNSERRVSRVRKAVEPPGEARPDFDIFLSLAERLGVGGELFPGWKTPEDAFEEWRQVSAGRLCDYGGITYDLLDETGGVQWPWTSHMAADVLAQPLASSVGTPRLYTDGRFPCPSGRAALRCVDPAPFPHYGRKQYPFVLNTGRTVEHWHTRTKTGRIPILERLAPEAWIEINPADAELLKVRSGDTINVASERGSLEGIAVRVTAIVRQGEVFIPFHWNEASANRLTSSEFDPISREPNYKQCAVRLDKIG